MNHSKKELKELIKNSKSKIDEVRYKKGFKILIKISETEPIKIYSYWNVFADYLDSDNKLQKHGAIIIIANLVRVDKSKKFDNIKKKLYNLLGDESFIVAMKTAMVLGKIAKARPDLQEEITELLLSLDKYEQEHKDLFKSAAINSFNEYYEKIKNKKKVIEYVKSLLNAQSPKARKMAKEFLKNVEMPRM